MIAADTSVFIDYFLGKQSAATDRLHKEILARSVALPPPVLSELLSDPAQTNDQRYRQLKEFMFLEPQQEFWIRAGRLRAMALRQGNKSRLADALIAQACIDHDVPLLTTDKDFRHYVKAGGLKLVKS